MLESFGKRFPEAFGKHSKFLLSIESQRHQSGALQGMFELFDEIHQLTDKTVDQIIELQKSSPSTIQKILHDRSIARDALFLVGSSSEIYSSSLENVISIFEILENPLAYEIYSARLRCFSDYGTPFEPFTGDNTQAASLLLEKISVCSTYEEKLRVFFDYLAEFKPFPPSQKYLVDVDVGAIVTCELERYIENTISSITSQEEYDQVTQLIDQLSRIGCNIDIFNKIKYSVGASIESEDWCSTRGYSDLMSEIWGSAKRRQAGLSDFKQPLAECLSRITPKKPRRHEKRKRDELETPRIFSKKERRDKDKVTAKKIDFSVGGTDLSM